MGSFSAVHWLIVGAIALLLFGGGARLAGIGKGLGEGIKNFKKGMKDDDDAPQRSLDDDEDEDARPAKRIAARSVDGDDRPKKTKKKVVTVEVDEDDDEEAIARKVARSKKVASVED